MFSTRKTSVLLIVAMCWISTIRAQDLNATLYKWANADLNQMMQTTTTERPLLTTLSTIQQQRKAHIQQVLSTAGSYINSVAGSTKTMLSGVSDAAASHSATMMGHFGTASNNLDGLVAGYEAAYCTPGAFTTYQKKMPAFTGAGFALTFDAGACAFNDTALIEDEVKELACVDPSISFYMTPAIFTSKYKKAASFKGKECKVTKKAGEEVIKTLYVFDGKEVPDVNKLMAMVQTELQAAMSGLSMDSAGGSLPDMSQVMAGYDSQLKTVQNQLRESMTKMLQGVSSIIPKPTI